MQVIMSSPCSNPPHTGPTYKLIKTSANKDVIFLMDTCHSKKLTLAT